MDITKKEETEFEKKLSDAFPFMDRNNEKAGSQYAQFGIEFNSPGWNPLVFECCREIAELYKEKGLPLNIAPLLIEVKYVKLRLCFDIEDEEMQEPVYEIIKKWSLLSTYTCFECGSAGYIKPTTYMLILCGACYIKYLEYKKEQDKKRNKEKILTREIADTMRDEHIIIPEEYEEIADFAFDNRHVKSIEIGKNIKRIGYRALSSFAVDEFRVDEANEKYSAVDGVLFDKSQLHLIKWPCCKEATAYVVPDSVLFIHEEAFSGCDAVLIRH